MEYGIVQYGTPLYVFDTDILEQTVRNVRTSLGETADLCFAMKANPFLVRTMADMTDRVEVCSEGEMNICRALGIEPEKLFISGVLKDREMLQDLLETYGNRCTYTVESLSQFYQFAEWSTTTKKKIQVYLRLSSGNQFGIDEQTLNNLVLLQNVCPGLEIKGIHYYSGTQKRKAEMIEEELHFLDVIIRGLEENAEFRLEELEYGPGLGVPYFEGEEDTISEDLERIRDSINHMKWKGRVILEMGRALTADCGYYLTTIKDVKDNNEKGYCIVDGGIHQIHYDGQVRGMYQPVFQICPEHKAGTDREWTICGSLCSANDILVGKAHLRGPKPGDILIFEKTGAYAMTEGMPLFLSHDMPRVALYSEKNGWSLLRDKQPTYVMNMGEVKKWKD